MTSDIAWIISCKMREALHSYCFQWIAFAFDDEDFARETMKQVTDVQVVEFLRDVEPGFPLLPPTTPDG